MNPGVTQPLNRGWPLQRQQRTQERRVRRRVVAFDRWARQRGLRHQDAAEQLGIVRGTLFRWQRRWRDDRLAARPLGRHCRRSDPEVRNGAIHLIEGAGPQIGVAAVRPPIRKWLAAR